MREKKFSLQVSIPASVKEKSSVLVKRLIEKISKNHAKILDDFTEAYLSSRWEDYFSKQKKVDFRRIELVHQIKSPNENVYWFRLRKGKLPIPKQ